MTDKERIDKLIQTLARVKSALSIVQRMTAEPETEDAITDIKKTIEFVIQQNADQITPNL